MICYYNSYFLKGSVWINFHLSELKLTHLSLRKLSRKKKKPWIVSSGCVSKFYYLCVCVCVCVLLSLSLKRHRHTMAPHSSTPAWKIPGTGEPGRLQSMESRRVRHDWATSLSLFTFMHWRRKWQPTPVFLPGESQGRQSLVGCRLWGHTKSNTTEAT